MVDNFSEFCYICKARAVSGFCCLFNKNSMYNENRINTQTRKFKNFIFENTSKER